MKTFIFSFLGSIAAWYVINHILSKPTATPGSVTVGNPQPSPQAAPTNITGAPTNELMNILKSIKL